MDLKLIYIIIWMIFTKSIIYIIVMYTLYFRLFGKLKFRIICKYPNIVEFFFFNFVNIDFSNSFTYSQIIYAFIVVIGT